MSVTEMNPEKSSLHYMVDRYKTDKTINDYTSLYYCLFQPYRECVENILEIGIGTVIANVPSTMYGQEFFDLPGYKPGASLRAFRDWFPKATVYGVDIQLDTQFTEERIVTMLADSTDQTQVEGCMLRRGIPKQHFDIIIDDGLHTQEAQLATVRNFFPYVKENGIYVIEDIAGTSELCHTPEKFEGLWKGKPWFINRKAHHALIVIRNADSG